MSDMDTGTLAPDTTSSETSTPSNSTALDLTSVTQTNDERTALQNYLPAEYKEAEWTQNILKTEKPIYEMAKKVDNLQKALHSRPAIPTTESTPEQVQAYYKALGVPETIDGYKYEPMQYEEADKEIGAFLDETREGPMMNGMKNVFKQAGLTPKQAQMVIRGYELNAIQNYRDQLIANSQANESLEVEMTKLGVQEFGTKEAFDAVTERAGKLTKQVMPAKAHAMLARASNESLMLLAYQAEGFRNTYLKQDGRIDNQAVSGGGVRTETDIRAEMRTVMATDDYQMPSRGSAHQQAVAKVTALRNQLATVYENQKR